jgi:hypothetical protein
MAIVHDFPSIARILNRQVQKAEFEAKQHDCSLLSQDACETRTLLIADLPRFELPDLRGRINAERLG